MTSAWSRGLLVRWWPNPRIYDRRSGLLALLDERYGLERFRADDDSVGAVLENGVEVVVGLDSMNVYAYVQSDVETHAKLFAELAKLVSDELAVSCRVVFFFLQHLEAWDEHDAPAACARAVNLALSPAISETLTPFDSALMVDGKRASGGTFQIEFGVVSSEEAPTRVSRLAGRAMGGRPTQHDLIAQQTFPDVATFADSTWIYPLGDDWVGELDFVVRDELIRADAEANEVVSALHKHMSSVRESVGGE